MIGSNHRQLDVVRLEAEAEQLVIARRPQEAVPLQRRAVALIREIVSEKPKPGPDDLRMLGALQYGLGNTLLSVDEPAAALSALNEAHACYLELIMYGDADVPQMIADVFLRRARLQRHTGNVTSAVLDSAEALAMMEPPEDGGPARVQYDLDRARVLAANATIVADYGDPDLAAASADAAVRLLLLRGAEINASGEVDFYVDILREAATLAELLHAGQGRTQIALAAGAVAIDTFVIAPAGRVLPLRGVIERLPAFRRRQMATAAMRHGLLLVSAGRQAEGAEQIAFARELDRDTADGVEAGWPQVIQGPVSLGTALRKARHVLGEQQVPDQLLWLAVYDGLAYPPVTPLERCKPRFQTESARLLAAIAEVLPHQSQEALRIGFEAHCLFALSYDGEPADLDTWYAENGRPWTLLLYAMITVLEERGEAELSGDLIRWLAIAAARMPPLYDPDHGHG